MGTGFSKSDFWVNYFKKQTTYNMYIYIYVCICICTYIHILATKNVKTPYWNGPGVGYGDPTWGTILDPEN